MVSIASILNNREIAVGVWLLIFSLWAFSIHSVRRSLPRLMTLLLDKKIIISVLAVLLYAFLMVFAFERIGFWDISALKDTVFWLFGVAFVILVNISEAASKENFFRDAVIDYFKLVLVIEFVVNLYSFSLLIELILVPIVSFLVVMNIFADSKPEYKRVKIVFDYILGLIGIAIIVFTIREIKADFQDFASFRNLRDLLLPIVLTVAFMPFVYLLALIMQYETIFIRIIFVNRDSDLARYAKWKIFTTCHFSLRKLNKFSRDVRLLRVSSKEDVIAIIERFKSNWKFPEDEV